MSYDGRGLRNENKKRPTSDYKPSNDDNDDKIPIVSSLNKKTHSQRQQQLGPNELEERLEISTTTAVRLREEKKTKLLVKRNSLKNLKTNSSNRSMTNTGAGLFRGRKTKIVKDNISFRNGEDFLDTEDGAGIGPVTLEDMQNALNKVQENKVLLNDDESKIYVYIESAVTGRFLKYAMSIDGKIIGNTEQNNSGNINCCMLCRKSETREQALSRIELMMKSASTFLNGLLAGYSVETLYEVLLNNKPNDFAIHYANRANESRRFYFMTISICLSMSLFQYEFKKKGRSTTLTNLDNARFLCIILCYLTCLALSLVASFIDEDLFQLEKQNNYKQKIDGENWYTAAKYLDEKELDIKVNQLRILCIFRGVLCIISWSVYCRRAFDEYFRLQEVETILKRIKGLSKNE